MWPLPHRTKTFGHSELPTIVTPSLQRATYFPSSLENFTLAPVRFTISLTRLQKALYDIQNTSLWINSGYPQTVAEKPPFRRHYGSSVRLHLALVILLAFVIQFVRLARHNTMANLSKIIAEIPVIGAGNRQRTAILFRVNRH